MKEKKQKFKVYCVPKNTPYVINDYEGFMRASEEQKKKKQHARRLNFDNIKFEDINHPKEGGIQLVLRRKQDKE